MENNKRDILILFAIFLGIPFLGYLFYSGNNGNLYGYYLTGYFFVVILFVAYVCSVLCRYKFGKLVLVLGVTIFLYSNLKLAYQKFSMDITNSKEIVFQNQLAAVLCIKNDSKSEKFNIDVYVPPVISYSYDYLFLWNNIKQDEKNVDLLYTLYEEDPPHPERLKAWLDRQKGIGKVIYQKSFGGITVQRRLRVNK